MAVRAVEEFLELYAEAFSEAFYESSPRRGGSPDEAPTPEMSSKRLAMRAPGGG